MKMTAVHQIQLLHFSIHHLLKRSGPVDRKVQGTFAGIRTPHSKVMDILKIHVTLHRFSRFSFLCTVKMLQVMCLNDNWEHGRMKRFLAILT